MNELTPFVYAELRRLAVSHLRREHFGHSLQPAALLRETYPRLIGQGQLRNSTGKR